MKVARLLLFLPLLLTGCAGLVWDEAKWNRDNHMDERFKEYMDGLDRHIPSEHYDYAYGQYENNAVLRAHRSR